MGLGSPKSMASFPKTLLPIAASVGGLALFLIFASLLLVGQPIGSTVSGYFYNLDQPTKIVLSPSNIETNLSEIQANDTETDRKTVDSGSDTIVTDSDNAVDSDSDKTIDPGSDKTVNSGSDKIADSGSDTIITDGDSDKTVDSGSDKTVDLGSDKTVDLGSNKTVDSGSDKTVDSGSDTIISDSDKSVDSDSDKSVDSSSDQTVDSGSDKTVDSGSDKTVDSGSDTIISDSDKTIDSGSNKTVDSDTKKTVDSGCDLYDGKWVHDSDGPLYSNNTCPVLSQMQNCQGNGRPDKDYENWRWKPSQCDLPRFDPKKFLELMRGKTLAFIGDSVARNQMESMLCILWQFEAPKNRGNKRMQRYYFPSTSTTIVRIWSSWLVHRTSESFDFAPEGIDKLHLTIPDETFINDVPTFDVIVLSSGHWFAKKSVYILNDEIVGGQLWWPDNSRKKKIDSPEAFEISVATIMSYLVTAPDYKGLTVVRSYSPDHYEGGAWNTGGSCTGKVKPGLDGEIVESGFTNTMHGKQVSGFNRGVKNQTNSSRVKFMDITKPFSYRHDGHPGPYRSLDPNKITKRSADGRPPPQDCLHWCMPGPVDTWNEFLLEIIRRDFEGKE